MNKNKFRLVTVLLVFFVSPFTWAQKAKQEPIKHEKEVRDIVAFFQFMLNTLGDDNTSNRDKDVLITESFTKVFRDKDVQIEDDLLENRNVITNKDVQAYLKDVDFFFRNVSFQFDIENIESNGSEDDKLFYKVSARRTIEGTTIEGKPVKNTVPRYIEINYNSKDRDLKIVSVYTNQFDEKKALQYWWDQLTYEWRSVFQRKFNLTDSLTIDDLKKITSLDSLDLSHNQYITSIEPLAQLLDLKVLDLSNTNITDLTPLRNLTTLQYLNVSDTEVDDISALRYASSLEQLYMNRTEVSNLEVVGRLPKLKTLALEKTPVFYVSHLNQLDKLERLNLSGTRVTALDSLNRMYSLKELYLSNTRIQDVQPVSRFTTVETLHLDSTYVSDINPLASVTSLKVLNINRTGVSTLSALHNLQLLEKIYCDNTLISKEAAQEFMAANPEVLVIFNSEELKIWWEDLPEVWQELLMQLGQTSSTPTQEEIARIRNLDSLNLAGQKNITHLEPLQEFQKLKALVANNTSVTDLTPLQNSKSLLMLDISGTGVSTLGPLRELNKLKVLQADNTPIQRLDTLIGLNSLEAIYADNTGVNDSAVSQFLKHQFHCLVVYKTATLQQWWNELSQEWSDAFDKQLPISSVPTREELHRLVELQKLYFSNVAIDDLSALSVFVNLQTLHISGAEIRDLSPLSQLYELHTLQVNDNPVSDLAPLAALNSLQEVDISNTAVDDLSALSGLDALKRLNCSGTQVKKLNPLKSLQNLEHLDCSNTNVRKLTPVMALPLKTLKCYNSRVSESQVERFKKSNPSCEVTYYR